MRARVTNIIKETAQISSFRLERQLWSYSAGQWMYVRLSPDLKHHFTISSSPTEDFLQFTTMFRPESGFKQALFKLKVGDSVDVAGPFGSFALDGEDKTSQLFIAGGIGITPFRSMLKYNQDKGLDLPLKLLYSVKNKSEGAFINQLEAIVVETETQGRLDEAKVNTLVPDWSNRTWWLCGPPAMVESLVELAQKMGVATDKIKSEEFTGYEKWQFCRQ